LKAGTSLLKRVTGRMFRKVSDFKKASRNFIFMFFTKREPNAVKTISAHTIRTYLIFRTFKKIFISWLYPFKEIG
jgi:hypothetical protein